MADVEIDGVNSKVYTDQVDPKTGTTLTLGTSGDTISIPSGVTITNSGTDGGGFGMDGTPLFSAYSESSQTISVTTSTKAELGSTQVDTNSAFASDQFTVPAGMQGDYLITWGARVPIPDQDNLVLQLRIGGSAITGYNGYGIITASKGDDDNIPKFADIIPLAAGEVLSMYIYWAGGSGSLATTLRFMKGVLIRSSA